MKNREQKEVYEMLKDYIMRNRQQKVKDLIETYGISYFQSFKEKKMGLLFYFMYYHRIEMVEWIVNKGWDVNEIDEHGNNLLFWSQFIERYDSFVDFLIRKGINVNQRGEMGFTPFLVALDSRCYRLARKLYVHGADVNLESTNGINTLFFITFENTDKHIAKKWVELLLSEPERCAEPLLKKLKEMRLEFLYK